MLADSWASVGSPLQTRGPQPWTRGLQDIVEGGYVVGHPHIPGVRQRWGLDVLHCPYCHGWEVRDQPIGVLGSGPFAVHQALAVPPVELFLHTAPDEEWEQLAARDISVVDGQVTAPEMSPRRRSARTASQASGWPRVASSRVGR